MTSTLRGVQLTTIQPTDPLKREAGCKPLARSCHSLRVVSLVMNVFIVLLEDPYATHFCGVFESRAAAQSFVEQDDREEIDGEFYVIDEVPVQKLIR